MNLTEEYKIIKLHVIHFGHKNNSKSQTKYIVFCLFFFDNLECLS
jgi:hypothetical protein